MTAPPKLPSYETTSNTPKFGHVKMNVPWVRHLRRSPGVRSLNLFQGMPLVCTGRCGSPADLQGHPHRHAVRRERPLLDIPHLIPLAFSCRADGADKMNGSYCRGVRK